MVRNCNTERVRKIFARGMKKCHGRLISRQVDIYHNESIISTWGHLDLSTLEFRYFEYYGTTVVVSGVPGVGVHTALILIADPGPQEPKVKD